MNRFKLKIPKLKHALMVGLLITVGTGFAINHWIVRRSKPRMHKTIGPIAGAEAAIIFGARVYSDGSPSATLADRLQTGLELYRAGRVGKILASGDHGSEEYNEVAVMGRWLKDRGVPPEDLFLDHAGFRTLDTVVRARQVFDVGSAIICTQEFHLPRALFLADRAGINATGLIADRRQYKGRVRNAIRENIARVVAFWDSYWFDTEPKYYGEKIPISGDGRATQKNNFNADPS